MEAYKVVKIARHPSRPSALYYINEICTDFIEFHGDRYFKDDKAIVGGVGMFKNIPVTVIGIQKGMDTKENIVRNFGQPNPEGYRKALRLMKQAEKFNRPILLFVNTSGAYCGVGAEERGQGEAIAKNLYEMFNIKVPILSFITGEGGSGGALALAVADKVYAMQNSVYSILSPEGFATILWKDDKRAKEAAKIMKLTSEDLLKLKIIDGIIEEAKDGAHNDPKIGAAAIKYTIESDLSYYKALSADEMLEKRYKRFRKY